MDAPFSTLLREYRELLSQREPANRLPSRFGLVRLYRFIKLYRLANYTTDRGYFELGIGAIYNQSTDGSLCPIDDDRLPIYVAHAPATKLVHESELLWARTEQRFRRKIAARLQPRQLCWYEVLRSHDDRRAPRRVVLLGKEARNPFVRSPRPYLPTTVLRLRQPRRPVPLFVALSSVYPVLKTLHRSMTPLDRSVFEELSSSSSSPSLSTSPPRKSVVGSPYRDDTPKMLLDFATACNQQLCKLIADESSDVQQNEHVVTAATFKFPYYPASEASYDPWVMDDGQRVSNLQHYDVVKNAGTMDSRYNITCGETFDMFFARCVNDGATMFRVDHKWWLFLMPVHLPLIVAGLRNLILPHNWRPLRGPGPLMLRHGAQQSFYLRDFYRGIRGHRRLLLELRQWQTAARLARGLTHATGSTVGACDRLHRYATPILATASLCRATSCMSFVYTITIREDFLVLSRWYAGTEGDDRLLHRNLTFSQQLRAAYDCVHRDLQSSEADDDDVYRYRYVDDVSQPGGGVGAHFVLPNHRYEPLPRFDLRDLSFVERGDDWYREYATAIPDRLINYTHSYRNDDLDLRLDLHWRLNEEVIAERTIDRLADELADMASDDDDRLADENRRLLDTDQHDDDEYADQDDGRDFMELNDEPNFTSHYVDWALQSPAPSDTYVPPL